MKTINNKTIGVRLLRFNTVGLHLYGLYTVARQEFEKPQIQP
jgi:hypothetical protein